MRGIRLYGLLMAFMVVLLTSCAPTAEGPTETPTALPQIRYRDALPLMLEAEDLGAGYEIAETRRLPKGKGWGEDTTRLSGYRAVFRGEGKPFATVTCQVECYLTVKEAQEAYRAFRQGMAAEIRNNSAYEAVRDAEEQQLGEWNHVYTAHSTDAMVVEYVFLRNNALVFLSFEGPQAPEFPDQAVRQARSLDDRIFRH